MPLTGLLFDIVINLMKVGESLCFFSIYMMDVRI